MRAYEKPNFHDFCICVRHPNGGHEQIVIRETSRRIACGKAMKGAPEGCRIASVKTPDEMTYDDRWSWGVQTAEDESRWNRECRERREYSNHYADMY